MTFSFRLIVLQIQTLFHMKGSAPGFVLKQIKATRKWLIELN